jgi:hypothetical protein
MSMVGLETRYLINDEGAGATASVAKNTNLLMMVAYDMTVHPKSTIISHTDEH